MTSSASKQVVVGTAQAAALFNLSSAHLASGDAAVASLAGIRQLVLTSPTNGSTDQTISVFSVAAATLIPGQKLEFTVAAAGIGWATVTVDDSGAHLTPLSVAGNGSSAATTAGRRRLLAAASAANATDARSAGNLTHTLLGIGSLQSFASSTAGDMAARWAAAGSPVVLDSTSSSPGLVAERQQVVGQQPCLQQTVCGSDGVTYQSTCVPAGVVVAGLGPCSSSSSSSNSSSLGSSAGTASAAPAAPSGKVSTGLAAVQAGTLATASPAPAGKASVQVVPAS